MDRRQRLTRFAERDRPGLEIAPWMNPLVPKAEGFKVRVLDVFDRARLVRNAEAVGLGDRAGRIEEVDFICDAAEIGGLAATEPRFTYVVSSHNFEHLPNPVKFLRGCSAIIEEGGHLSMAIPDKRCCFDYFRPVSTTAGVLAAYFENRSRPTPAQVFEQASLGATYLRKGKPVYGFTLADDLSHLHPGTGLETGFAAWQRSLAHPDAPYQDAHCWTFTPSSFELILRDLRRLGVVDLDVAEIVAPPGNEFIVHLVRTDAAAAQDRHFHATRRRLLWQTMRECAANVPEPA